MSVESANPGVGGNNTANNHPAFPGLDFDSKTTEWNPGDKAVYRAGEINNRQKTEYFVNVEGAERIKKKAEKEERLRHEQIRKELEEEDRKQAEAARARGKQGQQEQRQANREIAKVNKTKILQAIARRKVPIIITVLIVAVVTAAIIILPKINSSIAAENNNKFIQNNSTPMLDVYREVVTKELNKEQLTKIVSSKKGVVIDFYPEACIIHPKDDYGEKIEATMTTGGNNKFINFVYENNNGAKMVIILKEYDGYKYYYGETEYKYSSIDDAINASILDKKDENK